jgi:hypothetical protein
MNTQGGKVGAAGAALGVVAGLVQWALGSDIPEWTGNKLHPEQLGLITVALSAISLACVRYLDRIEAPWTRARLLAALLIGATAVICFTTVGRLWLVPGPLLLASLALFARGRGRPA